MSWAKLVSNWPQEEEKKFSSFSSSKEQEIIERWKLAQLPRERGEKKEDTRSHVERVLDSIYGTPEKCKTYVLIRKNLMKEFRIHLDCSYAIDYVFGRSRGTINYIERLVNLCKNEMKIRERNPDFRLDWFMPIRGEPLSEMEDLIQKELNKEGTK